MSGLRRHCASSRQESTARGRLTRRCTGGATAAMRSIPNFILAGHCFPLRLDGPSGVSGTQGIRAVAAMGWRVAPDALAHESGAADLAVVAQHHRREQFLRECADGLPAPLDGRHGTCRAAPIVNMSVACRRHFDARMPERKSFQVRVLTCAARVARTLQNRGTGIAEYLLSAFYWMRSCDPMRARAAGQRGAQAFPEALHGLAAFKGV